MKPRDLSFLRTRGHGARARLALQPPASSRAYGEVGLPLTRHTFRDGDAENCAAQSLLGSTRATCVTLVKVDSDFH